MRVSPGTWGIVWKGGCIMGNQCCSRGQRGIGFLGVEESPAPRDRGRAATQHGEISPDPRYSVSSAERGSSQVSPLQCMDPILFQSLSSV